jgi:hypothetical protein
MITQKQIDIIHDASIRCMKSRTLTEQESIIEDSIKEYEQSKWVRFDINDRTTYPEAGEYAFQYLVMTPHVVQPLCIIAHWDGRKWFANQRDIEVTHWQEFPAYPKK